MKKNLLTTMAISCAFVLGGMFTSCTTSDDNPSSKVEDPITQKLCQEKAWIDKDNVAVQNSLWAYTFNENGKIQISGLTKFGDPDQLLTINFSGKWKAINNYKDPYKVVNSNVRCYAVQLKLKDFSIDDEEVKIDDPTIYKDTLLVEYRDGKMKLCMASDIQRYFDSAKASTRSTESDLWGLVKAATPASAISEEELIETCIEAISNLSEDEITAIISSITDEDIQELIDVLEALTGEDYSDLFTDDDDDDADE